MLKFKLFIITFCMGFVWLVTGGLLLGTTNWKGTVSIALSGVLLNGVLAVYCTALERRLNRRLVRVAQRPRP